VNTQDIISSGLLELYATGNTTPTESAQVHAFVVQYPEVKEELNNIEAALEAYAFANAIQPKIKIQHKSFSQSNFTDNKSTAPVVSMSSKFKSIAAAAVILLAISAFANVFFYKKYKDTANLAELSKKELIEIREEEEAEKFELGIVHSKYSLPLKMNGSELAPGADAKIYWLTNTGEIFIDSRNLPAAPTGKQYQLWAIVNGKAEDAGLIQPQSSKILKLQKMKTFGKAEAFAVTLEVAGGVVASKEKPFVIVKL
jgi:anti-sigma-K factor RskA